MTKFSRFFVFLFCLAALIAISPVSAQDKNESDKQGTEAPVIPPMAPEKPIAPDVSMEAYGTAYPDCMEWTDTCQSCLRDAQNNVACSTPGIACLPQDISCKTKRGK